MTVVVRAELLTKRYRRGREVVIAVDDVSFELGAGVLTALVGPSGSGKTTLLNLLVGGDEPDEGRVVASLVELAAAGTSVLLATHDHRVLEACDRVLRMADGVVTER